VLNTSKSDSLDSDHTFCTF